MAKPPGSQHRPTGGDARPGEAPHFRALHDPEPGKGWVSHTDNESRRVQTRPGARTHQLRTLPALKRAAETHRKFSRFGSGRERPGKRPGSALGLGRNGPTLAGSAASNVAFCYFKLRVLAPEPWITTFTKPCISCSRNTSTSPGPLVLISHGR